MRGSPRNNAKMGHIYSILEDLLKHTKNFGSINSSRNLGKSSTWPLLSWVRILFTNKDFSQIFPFKKTLTERLLLHLHPGSTLRASLRLIGETEGVHIFVSNIIWGENADNSSLQTKGKHSDHTKRKSVAEPTNCMKLIKESFKAKAYKLIFNFRKSFCL